MNDLEQLWADVPVGTPDLATALREGTRLRRRRQALGAAVLGVVAVLGIGSGAALLPGKDPAPVAPAPPVVTEATGQTSETLYYFLPEPAPEEVANLLTARTVDVPVGGSPAVAALHHLMSAEPPAGLIAAQVYATDGARELTIDVESVEQEPGLVTVELTRDPYDPCRVCLFLDDFEGESVARAWAMTVQAALHTDDPVLFTADEAPVEGIWGWQVAGAVEAEQDIVVPPVTSRSLVQPIDLATGVGGGSPSLATGTGTVDVGRNGCVVLVTEDGPQPVIWPTGWTAWLSEPGLVLLDHRGHIAARGYQEIEVEGVTRPSPGGGCAPSEGRPVLQVELLQIR